MITNKAGSGQDQAVMHAVARFGPGQVVTHRHHNYRGVVVDIDPVFLGSNALYEEVAQHRPARNQPWYKVLVNDTLDETYVPEQDLVADVSDRQINHPLVGAYFDHFDNGQYRNSSWRPH